MITLQFVLLVNKDRLHLFITNTHGKKRHWNIMFLPPSLSDPFRGDAWGPTLCFRQKMNIRKCKLPVKTNGNFPFSPTTCITI